MYSFPCLLLLFTCSFSFVVTATVEVKSIAVNYEPRNFLNEVKDIFRFIRVSKFSKKAQQELLSFCESRPSNLQHLSAKSEFKIVTVKKTLGKGAKVFHAASQLITNGNITNDLSWSQLIYHPVKRFQPHATIATMTRFYNFPLWSFNPCRVSHREVDQPVQVYRPTQLQLKLVENQVSGMEPNVRRYSRLVYHTLQGHFLRGEEGLYVKHHQDDTVTFEMTSYAGAGSRLIKPFMRFIRPLQRKFIADHANYFDQLGMAVSSRSAVSPSA